MIFLGFFMKLMIRRNSARTQLPTSGISRRGSLGPEVTREHFKLDARCLTVSIEIIKLSMSCASCNPFVSRPPQSISARQEFPEMLHQKAAWHVPEARFGFQECWFGCGAVM